MARRTVVLDSIERERAVQDESEWPVAPTEGKSGADDGDAQFEPTRPAREYVAQRIDVESEDGSTQQGAVAIGGRKTASARVFITPGSGSVVVNGRLLVDWVSSLRLRDQAVRPLLVTETLGRFDVTAETRGGGTSGQIGALAHGLARALQNWDPDWRPVLKREGLLMRDPRMVERKKTGQPKARKQGTWSKR